ncbi:MAG TPA: ATP-binding cassette domain-containing protein [Fimbriimonas sp.]
MHELVTDAARPSAALSPALELRAVSKSFGGVHALRNVDLELQPGSIHALVGENGAGKSTLVNICTGVLQPDQGRLTIEGREGAIPSPSDAARLGIHVVHQEAELFSQLSLAENMLLAEGLERRPGIPWLIDWNATYAKAENVLAGTGAAGRSRSLAGELSIGHRVQASLAAAVSSCPKVLFLDEPTASLTHRETARLLDELVRLRNEGVAIVYVSHRLEEVLAIADVVTILRDGVRVATEPAPGLTQQDLVSRMVGRELQTVDRAPYEGEPETVLRLDRVGSPSGTFRDVSLELRRGEILGLYGLVGAGRTELARAIFGLDPIAGVVELHGKPLSIERPAQAVSAGLAFLPEDRLNESIFPTHSCRSNLTVASLREMGPLGFVSNQREVEATRRTVHGLGVRLGSVEQPISTLSGGNQQKLVFGRWLETEPEVLILDEPTRGVDVAAKAQIHQLVCDLAARGKAILLISSELPEVMAVSDRILVMAEGKVTAEIDPSRSSEDEIVAAALPRSPKRDDGPVPSAHPRLRAILAFRELGIGAALVAIALLMAIARPAEFLSLKNGLDVLTSASIVSVAAIGMTLVIITGGIDISVGRMLGLVGAAAGMAAIAGLHPALCLMLAVAIGLALGSANSLLSTIGRIHPIVVTLAGMSVFQGLMLLLTKGYEVHPLPDGYRTLVDGRILFLPKVLVWSLAVLAGGWVLLQQTILGRRMLAVGDSERASVLIGLKPWRLRLAAFAIMGALIGLASVMWGGYYGKIQGNTGAGFELQAIAAAVVGGCSILGGRGTALGAFLGAVLIALIRNSLVLLKINSYWQDLFVGLLILAAVLVDLWLVRLAASRCEVAP